jgi:hypothetical protein
MLDSKLSEIVLIVSFIVLKIILGTTDFHFYVKLYYSFIES